MQLVSTTKKEYLLHTLVENKTFSKSKKEYQGKPEFLFRRMISEVSLIGSDLMVEPYDEIDY